MAIVPSPVSEQIYDFAEHPPRGRLRHWMRACLVLVVVALAGVFAVAITLDPYQDGKVWLMETHRQLGLPECTFKRVTGYPCPSCGMTSSFALAIRGDLWHAVQANCAGAVLALACLACIPWAALCAIRGRLVGIRNFETVLVRGVVGFFILMFGRWAIVLALSCWNR